MTNQELENQIQDLKQQLDKTNQIVFKLNDLYFRQHFIDKDVFNNPVYLNGKVFYKDASIISLGTTTGTKFGNATTEKIGFLGQTPITRQSAITKPTGGAVIDAESRTAINSIIDLIQNFGFSA